MYILDPNVLKPPMVYKIGFDTINKVYYLLEDISRFNEPVKYYGNIIKYSNHFFNTFNVSKGSMGVMLVGAAGTGKTLMSERIANLALSNGYKVVKVVNIKVDIALIDFIDSLGDTVVLLDEFAKNFYHDMQNKMLTTLSNDSGGKKLFIITENSKSMISPLIRNRPGRVRYRLYFGKLEKDVIIEYCADHNVKNTFTNELLELYDGSATFSFDHLQALVSEHLMYPNYTVKELIGILNLDILGGTKKYKLVEVEDLDGNMLDFTPHSIDYVEWFTDNDENYYYVNIKNKKLKEDSDDISNSRPNIIFNSGPLSISYSKKNVKYSDDKEFIVKTKKYKLKYVLTEDK